MRLFGSVPLAFCDEQHRAAAESVPRRRAPRRTRARRISSTRGSRACTSCALSWQRNKPAIDAFLAKY